jgi:GGDEF domain-containing protein
VLGRSIDIEFAELISERIQQAVERPIELSPDIPPVSIGVSIGIKVGDREKIETELIREADDAMYDQKRERSR